MNDHLHVYAADGRCIVSMPLQRRTLAAGIEPTDESRTAYAAYPQGWTLTEWHREERAGLARNKEGESFILRIKPSGVMRNMHRAGVSALMEAFRLEGFAVEAVTGLPLDEQGKTTMEDYETRLAKVAELMRQIRDLGFAVCAVGAGDASALEGDEAQAFIDDNLQDIEDTMSTAGNAYIDMNGAAARD